MPDPHRPGEPGPWCNRRRGKKKRKKKKKSNKVVDLVSGRGWRLYQGHGGHFEEKKRKKEKEPDEMNGDERGGRIKDTPRRGPGATGGSTDAHGLRSQCHPGAWYPALHRHRRPERPFLPPPAPGASARAAFYSLPPCLSSPCISSGSFSLFFFFFFIPSVHRALGKTALLRQRLSPRETLGATKGHQEGMSVGPRAPAGRQKLGSRADFQ